MSLRVALTRPIDDARRSAEALRARGFEPVLAPVMTLRATGAAPPDGSFDALLATSANAFAWLAADAGAGLTGLALYLAGERTAAAASAAGFGAAEADRRRRRRACGRGRCAAAARVAASVSDRTRPQRRSRSGARRRWPSRRRDRGLRGGRAGRVERRRGAGRRHLRGGVALFAAQRRTRRRFSPSALALARNFARSSTLPVAGRRRAVARLRRNADRGRRGPRESLLIDALCSAAGDRQRAAPCCGFRRLVPHCGQIETASAASLEERAPRVSFLRLLAYRRAGSEEESVCRTRRSRPPILTAPRPPIAIGAASPGDRRRGR